MSLVSPGVEASVIDESNYSTTAIGTVPYILVATAQNKAAPNSSGVAVGTTAGNANKLFSISSQRELVTTFGNPTFSSIAGDELNEYGLLTAYNLLGITNRVYVQRADIDLSQLAGTSVRPVGPVANNTYWLDTLETRWGIFEWNASTQKFLVKTPVVITNTNDLDAGVPKTSIGSLGSYAIDTTDTGNPAYYKKYDGSWVTVGSIDWQQAHVTIQATVANPTLIALSQIVINTNTVVVPVAPNNTVSGIVDEINQLVALAELTGIFARNNAGKLEIFADATAASNGTTADGKVAISNGSGDPLGALGITAGTYACPAVQISSHVSVPTWKTQDSVPRPSGSVWVKSTAFNSGAFFDISLYNSNTGLWTSRLANLYANDAEANRAIDASGGSAIPANAVYVQYDYLENSTVTYKIFRRIAGDTVVTGTVAPGSTAFSISDEFSIKVSQPGSSTFTAPVTVTLTGDSPESFVSDLILADIPNLTVEFTSLGRIRLTHNLGGVIVLKNVTGTPLDAAGFTTSTSFVRAGNDIDLILSNWVELEYTVSQVQPVSLPSDGTFWYFDATDVDIMMHDGTTWKGYQNVTADARGYDLSDTDPLGVIVSASEPETQSDGTDLELGDLWLNTSNLENFPRLYRWQTENDQEQWVLIDNTDNTSENGILFADARWDASVQSAVSVGGLIDPVTGSIPSTVDMLSSDYVDLDAPNPALYPRGILLWNLRRSGFVVKQFVKNYFNSASFPDENLPVVRNTWKTASGLKFDGSPYLARAAQRNVIVSALKAAMSASTELREDRVDFNLIASPGYPELIPNMIQLNSDRRETAFIVGDTPMRLKPATTEIFNWANNVIGTGESGEASLANSSPYLALYYPHGVTNDLSGKSVVVPSSHMALRTLIKSDSISFPWLAPAGIRRGLVDNASRLGYISSETNEFVEIGTNEDLRNVLYENRINPITLIPSAGITVYGNKTLAAFNSALDRINVARLVSFLRSQLTELVKPFIFEPNDKLTRDEVKQTVEKLLNDLVSKRAIGDYLVVCDTTNNTPARVDRNELYVDVAIEPIKAVEFIYIPIRIKNTGELASGNIASTNPV
jgi:hypothetical protein